MFTTRRRAGGMTLIEILVAITLFAIFTLTLTQLLMGGMRTFKRGQAISSLRNDLKLAVEMFSADMRNASEIGGLVKGNKAFRVSMNRRLQNITNPTMVSPNTSTITYTLNPDAGVLIRTEGSKNTLVARDLEIDSTPGSSPSYFELLLESGTENHPDNEVELRLSALRYVGTDEQRMSMVTRSTATSTLYNTILDSTRVDMVPAVKIGDLRRPLSARWMR